MPPSARTFVVRALDAGGEHGVNRVNVNTLERQAAKTLELNQIGVSNAYLERTILFETNRDNHELGGCIVIDRMSNATVGASRSPNSAIVHGTVASSATRLDALGLVPNPLMHEAVGMKHPRPIRPIQPSRWALVGFRFPPEVMLIAVRYLRLDCRTRIWRSCSANAGIEVDHVTLFRWVQRFTPAPRIFLVIDSRASISRALRRSACRTSALRWWTASASTSRSSPVRGLEERRPPVGGMPSSLCQLLLCGLGSSVSGITNRCS